MALIQEIKGNIFQSRCQTLVNTVNCGGVMGKGIAREFRFRFPCMFEAYKKTCEKKLLRPGMVQLIRDQNPWILNFPTKDDWKQPSKIEYVVDGLKKFALTYKDMRIKSIAFPRLGVYSGGLEWQIVRSAMYKYLESLSNLEVEIYEFDPNSFDSLFESLKKFLQQNANHKLLKISKKKLDTLVWGIEMSKIKSMPDLSALKGIGEKSLEKLYAAASGSMGSERYSAVNKIQMKFF